MIRVGAETFLSVLGMYGTVTVELKPMKVEFRSGGRIGIYDRRRGEYLVESEELRRLTESLWS